MFNYLREQESQKTGDLASQVTEGQRVSRAVERNRSLVLGVASKRYGDGLSGWQPAVSCPVVWAHLSWLARFSRRELMTLVFLLEDPLQADREGSEKAPGCSCRSAGALGSRRSAHPTAAFWGSNSGFPGCMSPGSSVRAKNQCSSTGLSGLLRGLQAALTVASGSESLLPRSAPDSRFPVRMPR